MVHLFINRVHLFNIDPNVWSMKEYVFGEASACFTLIEKQAVGMFRNFQIGAKCYVVFTLLRVWNMKKVKHYTMKIE